MLQTVTSLNTIPFHPVSATHTQSLHHHLNMDCVSCCHLDADWSNMDCVSCCHLDADWSSIFVCLLFNCTFSTNRLYHAIEVWCISRRQQHKYHAIKHNKPTQYKVLFGLGFMEMIPSPRLGFLRGVFLANHLASNDNLTRTTKRQNTYNEN